MEAPDTSEAMALAALPDTFESTRHALWRLAVHVVYRKRRAATGRYGLRWTLGGFGTPVFGDDEQVRVSGGALVRQRGDDLSVAPITSIEEAAHFVGLEFDADFDHGFRDVVDPGDSAADLEIDPAAAVALGGWFGFATAALEIVRRTATDPSAVQLWPERFDVAMDVAVAEPVGERRANVGGSPGDGFHTAPYLYVGPWTDDRPGPDDGYWNAPFGAVLGYDEILAAGDGEAQLARAVGFLASGLERLSSA